MAREIIPGVTELDEAEGRAMFDTRCRDYLGMSGEEFLALHDEGALIPGDPAAIHHVLMLLPFAR